MEGWIKLHRKIADNSDYFSEPFCRNMAWVDLLILANHKPQFIRKRGIRFEVKRGEVGWSLRELSKRWKWSIGKVIRFLNELEIDKKVVTQKTNVTNCISIVNYAKYQDGSNTDGYTNSNTNGTQTGTQTEHRRVRNNNEENENNENNEKKDYEIFIATISRITGKKFKGDRKSMGSFHARISEGATLEEIEWAVQNCFADPYHQQNTKYLTPEFITRPDKFQTYFLAKPMSKKIAAPKVGEVGYIFTEPKWQIDAEVYPEGIRYGNNHQRLNGGLSAIGLQEHCERIGIEYAE